MNLEVFTNSLRNIEVNLVIQMKTEKKIATLKKLSMFPFLPRIGETVENPNDDIGSYFSFTVINVDHKVEATPEVWLTMKKVEYDNLVDDYWPEDCFDEDVNSYIENGWELVSSMENKIKKQDDDE